EVIHNGNGPVSITTYTQGQIKVLPPRTAEEILARERERKARTTLLMALPEDHIAKFYKMTDAKEMWEVIKSRFGGNDESKKMHKFQSLMVQLEIHGACVSTEDAKQKFLRSLPSTWSQVSLIIRIKPRVDSLSFDDLYNNLRVFENDVKGSTASSSSTQNVAFVSENTSSINDVAMISMRMKKFYKKTGRKLQFDPKEPVGFDKTKVECYNCHKTGHFARECKTKGNQDSKRRDAWNSRNKDVRRSGKQEDSKALVTIDGEGVDWTSHSEEKEDYALMACNSSGSDNKRMAKQAELNNRIRKKSSQREIRTIWNNVQRVNHKNQFVPTAVLTRTGKILVNTARTSGTNTVNTARHNFNRQAVQTNAAMKVNTVKPIVNNARPKGKSISAVGEKENCCKRALNRNIHTELTEQRDCLKVDVPDHDRNTGLLAEYHKTLMVALFALEKCVTRRTSLNLENIVPSGGLAYLIAKATIDESNKWHRRLNLMNYQHVRSKNQANKHAGPQEANQNAGTEDNIDAGDSEIKVESAQDYFVLPIWSSYTSTIKSSKVNNACEEPTKHPDFKQVDKEDQVFVDELKRLKRQEQDTNDAAEALRKEFSQETEDLLLQARAAKASSTNIVNTISPPVSTASPYGGLSFTDLTNTDQDDSEIPALKDIYDNPTDGIFTNSSYNDEGAVADFTNLEPIVNVSPIHTSRINSIHPSTLILRDPQSVVQIRSKVTKSSGAHAFEELLQFKIQKVWILVDLPYGKKAIGTKWVYRNKKDERGVVVRNKARLVAQGHRQEEGIDYDEK
ncbi:ribonuclease H-like domain-containing protein, partial [Tanacetum coccineum]